NFNLALQHAGTAKDVASLKIGLDFIAQQLETALKEAGLEPIEAKGKTFDPTQHDALEEIEVEGVEAGTVVEETQRGYQLDGQVLRPSRVKVAK
ncbi:MAG TPA: nucleotide exchange factor GrpE, partial [Abditibacterium sp.]